MNNYQNQNWNNNQQNNQNNQQQTNSNAQNQPNNQPSGLMQIVGMVLPSLIEHFTGQKMTPNGSSSPKMQLVLSQVLSIQQQILTNQQALNQRLVALETNASQQFTNLVQQVQSIKSIRLTHQKETKAVDFGLQQEQTKEY